MVWTRRNYERKRKKGIQKEVDKRPNEHRDEGEEKVNK